MIATMGRKAFTGMRDGMDGLLESRLAEKMGIGRMPFGRKALGLMGPRPGTAALIVLGAAALAAGIWYYLRKRRQVAAHYTMGEGGFESAPDRSRETPAARAS